MANFICAAHSNPDYPENFHTKNICPLQALQARYHQHLYPVDPLHSLQRTLYFTRLQDPLFVEQQTLEPAEEEKVKSRIKKASGEEEVSVYGYKNERGSLLCGYSEKSRANQTNKKVVLFFKPRGSTSIPDTPSSDGVESYLLDEGYDVFYPSY